MSDGFLVPSNTSFQTIRPEYAGVDVARPAPTGVNIINEDEIVPMLGVERVAYPFQYFLTVYGTLVSSFFDDYYNRIHVYPNPLDFGYIASDSERSFQVWNAYLIPQYLESLTVTGAEGITISGGPVSDIWFKGLEAINYTLSTGVNGPASSNATYQFTFTGVSVPVLVATGTRVIIFPFAANWRSSVLERLDWMTSVTEFRNGGEERARMRQNPRQTLEFEVLVHHDDFQLLASLLFGWQGRAWGVPLWPQGQRLTFSYLAGSSVFSLNTVGYEYQVGGNIIFYSTPTRYEVLTISAVSETSVTTSTGLLNNWSAHSLVFPLRIAFLQGSPVVRKITGEVAVGTVQFKSQQHLLGASDWPATYKSLPVLELDPQRKEHVEETWNRRTAELDYQVGQARVFDKDDFSTPVRSAQYWGINRTKLAALRSVFNYAQGMWKPFWAPTFDRDLRLVQTINQGGAVMIVMLVQFTRYAWPHPYRKHIRIQLKSGEILYREVAGADDVNSPVNTETLTVTEAFPNQISPSEVHMISFMPLARLASDSIEIGWETMTVANTTLPIRPVQDTTI